MYELDDTMEVRRVPTDRIDPAPFNAEIYDEITADDDLRASIAERGILAPLVLRASPDDPSRFEVVSGNRRLHAALTLGLSDVPAYLRDCDDVTARRLLVESNVGRQKTYADIAREIGFWRAYDTPSDQGSSVTLSDGENVVENAGNNHAESGKGTASTSVEVTRSVTSILQVIAERLRQPESTVFRVRGVYDDSYLNGRFEALMARRAARRTEQDVADAVAGVRAEIGRVREQCTAGTVGLRGAYDTVQDLLSRLEAAICDKRKAKPASATKKTAPQKTRRELLRLIDSTREFTVMGAFENGQVSVEFGSVFFDMEQRPAFRLPQGTYMVDLQTLYDQHLKGLIR